MFFAVDVQYHDDNTATAAGLLFGDWESDAIAHSLTKRIHNISPYEPGQFYKRELPCILSLLQDIPQPINLIIVDGYVTLGEDQRPGLGMHLYEVMSPKIPIIGVAKRAFVGTPTEFEVLRGASETPLYVSAVGIELAMAKIHIQQMHGQYRIPTLLKRVDQLCRGIEPT